MVICAGQSAALIDTMPTAAGRIDAIMGEAQIALACFATLTAGGHA